MCRLLGIKNFDSKAHAEILRQFFLLAKDGAVSPGNPFGHRDGWGIGWYVDGKAKVEKSGASALDSTRKISAVIDSIGTSKVLIAHLRKSAWRDTATARHAHPFAFKNVIFAHNGTILDYQTLQRSIPKEFAPEPDSLDTEVLLRAIMDSPESSLKNKFTETVKSVITLKYTALNILMSDGKSLYGFRDCTKYPDYYTLYSTKVGDSPMMCSEPLPAAPNWTAFKNDQLIIL
jgi:predicted glutamine amidotransferase